MLKKKNIKVLSIYQWSCQSSSTLHCLGHHVISIGWLKAIPACIVRARHTLKCTGTWGLTYVRPLSHGDPATVSFFLGAAKFLSERLSKRSSPSQNEKKKKTDGGGWDDDKRKRRLTHYKVHVNATRECVKRRDPCIRATCADFSKGPPACQLWGFE